MKNVSGIHQTLLLFFRLVQRKSWLQDVERMSAARPRMD